MTGTPEEHDDDLGLPAMDSNTTRLLRYATKLRWDDPAYVLGCFQWNCAQDEYSLSQDDRVSASAIAEAQQRSNELLQMWREWMNRYPDLYAKRVTRWSGRDDLPIGTRLELRLGFLSAELKTIAGEVKFTDALGPDEQRFANAEVAIMRDHVTTLLEWINDRKGRMNETDAATDPDESIQ